MIMNINTLGYDFIQGPMGVWNFACFGATAGVLFLSIRDKDKDMRQTSIGALAAGLLGGVSEPSLYGIHLRYKLIYSRMLVGCGVGGVVIAVMGWLFPATVASGETVHGVTTTAFAFTSLLTVPVFNQMWVYGVSIAVSFFTAMIMIIMLDYRTPEQKAEAKARAAAQSAKAVNGGDATTATATAAVAVADAPAAAATATSAVFAPIAATWYPLTMPAIRCSLLVPSARAWASSRLTARLRLRCPVCCRPLLRLAMLLVSRPTMALKCWYTSALIRLR